MAQNVLGSDHVAALFVTLAAGIWLLRTRSRIAEKSLAGLLLAALMANPLIALAYGGNIWTEALPFEICDAAALAVAGALWGRSRNLGELAYYWGLALTIWGLLTPVVEERCFHPNALRYYVLHGGIVVGAAYLASRHRPRPGSWLRAFVATLAWAALIAPIDWLLGANYMWLRSAPKNTPMDWFGPWPAYLLVATLISLVLYGLLYLPWWYLRAQSPRQTSG